MSSYYYTMRNAINEITGGNNTNSSSPAALRAMMLDTNAVVRPTANPAQNEAVYLTQTGLNKLEYAGVDGYPLQNDGWLGENTAKAISDYQKDNRLPATGSLDAPTFDSLMSRFEFNNYLGLTGKVDSPLQMGLTAPEKKLARDLRYPLEKIMLSDTGKANPPYKTDVIQEAIDNLRNSQKNKSTPLDDYTKQSDIYNKASEIYPNVSRDFNLEVNDEIADKIPNNEKLGIPTFNRKKIDLEDYYKFNNGYNGGADYYSKATDGEGYIYNQSALKDIPFGNFTSDQKGCSWIAVYNALLALGDTPEAEDVINGMSNGPLFNALKGELGTDPLVVNAYLKKQGYKTNFSWNESSTDEKKFTDVNIILYWNKPSDNNKNNEDETVVTESDLDIWKKFRNLMNSLNSEEDFDVNNIKTQALEYARNDEILKQYANGLHYVVFLPIGINEDGEKTYKFINGGGSTVDPLYDENGVLVQKDGLGVFRPAKEEHYFNGTFSKFLNEVAGKPISTISIKGKK